jgi:hypothetical protein
VTQAGHRPMTSTVTQAGRRAMTLAVTQAGCKAMTSTVTQADDVGQSDENRTFDGWTDGGSTNERKLQG